MTPEHESPPPVQVRTAEEKEGACQTCAGSGVLLTPDPDGESAWSQQCPDCDTPYPSGGGSTEADEKAPF